MMNSSLDKPEWLKAWILVRYFLQTYDDVNNIDEYDDDIDRDDDYDIGVSDDGVNNDHDGKDDDYIDNNCSDSCSITIRSI